MEQKAYIDGFKEQLYGLFDEYFPKDQMSKLIGLTEYEGIAQDFRQELDTMVEDNMIALLTTFQQQIDAKDGENRDLSAANIDLTTQADQVRAELADKQTALAEMEGQIASLKADLNARVSEIEELERKNTSLTERLNKLEELAKAPTSQLVLPAVAPKEKPQANSKVRSALEIALEGRQFRGSVTITMPKLQETEIPMPSAFGTGGSDATDTFPGDTQTEPTGDQLSATETATNVGDSFPAEVSDEHNTVDGNADHVEMVGQTNVEARLQALEARVAKLEQNQSGVAA